MNSLSIQTQQTMSMSSTEIATLTGKEKSNVHRDIQAQILKGLYEIDDSNLNHIEIQGVAIVLDNRGYVSEYHLDKEHSLTLITGYDVKMRHVINKRWLELEQQAIKQNSKPTGFLPQIAKEFRGALSITKMLGLSGNQAYLHADGAVQKTTGHSVIKLFDVELMSPNQERHFNVTTLAEMTGFKSAIALNNELAAKGFQAKVGKAWSPTEKGKPFAVLLDKNKAHTHGTVQQLEWRESIKYELSKTNAGGTAHA